MNARVSPGEANHSRSQNSDRAPSSGPGTESLPQYLGSYLVRSVSVSSLLSAGLRTPRRSPESMHGQAGPGLGNFSVLTVSGSACCLPLFPFPIQQFINVLASGPLAS